jgi:hypothetical protein
MPFHRREQAGLEGMLGRPAKLGVQFAEVDCIAKIVPGAIWHELDQLAMRHAVRASGERIQGVADRADDIDVATPPML